MKTEIPRQSKPSSALLIIPQDLAATAGAQVTAKHSDSLALKPTISSASSFAHPGADLASHASRSQRLQELKQAVNDGSYQVPVERLACIMQPLFDRKLHHQKTEESHHRGPSMNISGSSVHPIHRKATRAGACAC